MPDSTAALTLIGGPTVVVELYDFRLLTDPTFDPPGRYEGATSTLEKLRGPAHGAEAMAPVDAVLLSHDQHFDNLDHAGRVFTRSAARTFTTVAGAGRLGGTAHGLKPWETRTLTNQYGPLLVTATPARHGPRGIEPISGEVTGFALGRAAPGDAIYISGDTVWYEGVAEIAQRFRPKIVILFTGAAKTRARVHLTMDTNDAIEAAHAFRDAAIVAVHNDGWAHFSESAADVMQAFQALGLAGRLTPIAPGERIELPLA